MITRGPPLPSLAAAPRGTDANPVVGTTAAAITIATAIIDPRRRPPTVAPRRQRI